MKSLALLLFIGVGVSVAEDCGKNEIACPNSEKCIPLHYICDIGGDCYDASDEDPELCHAWRNTKCERNHVECTRNGETKCIEISDYCTLESPQCEGELDRRICVMLESGRIAELSSFALPTEPASECIQSIELAKKFDSVLPYTMSHVSCPKFYTLVGDQCISIFLVGGMSWGESRAFCNVLGGDLLTFKNATQFAEITQRLQSLELTSDFWIGASIESTIVGWTWLDGSRMEMGSPFWATRYSPTCIQRNVTMGTSETTCYRYYQAPEEVTKGECASLSFQHSFYVTDEDCLRKMSPICVYQGLDFPRRPSLRDNIIGTLDFPRRPSLRDNIIGTLDFPRRHSLRENIIEMFKDN